MLSTRGISIFFSFFMLFINIKQDLLTHTSLPSQGRRRSKKKNSILKEKLTIFFQIQLLFLIVRTAEVITYSWVKCVIHPFLGYRSLWVLIMDATVVSVFYCCG